MSVGFGPGYNRFDVNAIESRGDTLVIITFPDVSLPEFLFDHDQYAMLIRCSEKGDSSEWNEWLVNRSDNPASDIRLQGADFAHADLHGINLAKAHLEGANFYAANLSNANLSDSNLRGTNLCAATMQETNLCNANLAGANLASTDLQSADLRRTHRSGSDLRGANTQGAVFYFSGSNMVTF